MPRKKITVVNIDDNDNINAENVNVEEPVQEPIEKIEKPIEPIENVDKPIEKVEDAPIEIIKENNDKPIEKVEDKPIIQKMTRTNELVKCEKCQKMVTAKTLKYSHKKNMHR